MGGHRTVKKKGVKRFVREKKIYCGENYLEVDVIPCSNQKKDRGEKSKESSQAQKNLNEKNAKRRFVQLGNTNFGKGDLCVDCTYADDFLPGTQLPGRKKQHAYQHAPQTHLTVCAAHGFKIQLLRGKCFLHLRSSPSRAD